MANQNKGSIMSPSSLKSNALNANAEAFIPSPITATTSPSNASPCAETPCFSKSKLETIPESPSTAPLLPSKPPPDITTNTPQAQSQFQTQFPFNPLSLPQFYANQMNDTLALIPAMDQNGLLVMIPPSLVTPGSLFTPLINVGQPLIPITDTEHDDAHMYSYMEVDTNQHPMDDKYQNIDDIKHDIKVKYHNDTIDSIPKPQNSKYSNTFLLRTAHVLNKDITSNNDILSDIPKDLQFLVSKDSDTIDDINNPFVPMNPYFVSPHQAIADMQSLLFMNNYTSIPTQFYPQNNYIQEEGAPQQAPITPKRRKKYGNNYKLPPRFQENAIDDAPPSVLDHKVVYLVSGGNKSNGGFAQYSLSPSATPKPKRYKQSVTGMKFEGRRNREVHECFGDNPDLFARGGYESVMNKINYQIPNKCSSHAADKETCLHKRLSGILNKLTPEKFNHLLSVTVNLITHNNLSVCAGVFHSVIIREKPFVGLYASFLIEISTRCDLVYSDLCLLDLVLDLIWKQIDNEYIEHSSMQYSDEYNNWLHRLYGNYVLLTELYCRNNDLFCYSKLHSNIVGLIKENKEWTWNIVYVILIFHGIALQKICAKSLEEYLCSIDELVDGIHLANSKYCDIPLRIKYLLMDVQEHIESANARHIDKAFIMNPKKLNEIHDEFCLENNMSKEQLRSLLSVSRKDHHLQHQHHQNTHSHKSAQYLRRFAPQQNEYPWHTPPRFQRMRQQQRAQNRKKKQQVVCPKGGPLYLRNPLVPAPPNKCPPPPPGPPGPLPFIKVITNKCNKKKKKYHKKDKENGWSTVKRSNKMNKKSVIIKKKNIIIKKQQYRSISIKKQPEKVFVKREEKEKEKEEIIYSKEPKIINKKAKNKKKKKKKKAKKKKKKKDKKKEFNDDEKECEISCSILNDDCDDDDDYDSSDDEIWCETTESYEEDDVVPFLYGAENETERLEELETALFCEYIDDEYYDDDDDCVAIINSYLETGNDDCVYQYIASCDKDIFIANCIKLYISKEKNQHELREIERLFVRQMYYNSILDKCNYINSFKLLSKYFQDLLVEKHRILSKILVILCENGILTITDIANLLKMENVLYLVVKHLMHNSINDTLSLRALMAEIKHIKFIKFKINKICNELNIDYAKLI